MACASTCTDHRSDWRRVDHVEPRVHDQPDDRKGPAVFGYLSDGQSLASERRDDLAAALLAAWPA